MRSLLINHAYINGKWCNAINKKTFPVCNPSNNQILGRVPLMNGDDAKLAIRSAHSAFGIWRNIPSKQRSQILRKIFDLMLKHREEFAQIISLEQGKSIHEARAEVDYSASFLEWFGEEAKRISGDILPPLKANQQMFTFKEPIGVVAAITPWNFPLAMLARKIAPALAAGCTTVVKPSEETPYTALFFAHIAEEAGLLPGALNVIFGDAKSIGDAICESDDVKMLTFTGSTSIGKMLMSKCSDTVKKVTLELGGNAPFIVFEDVNIEKAVDGLFASKMRNGGQSCICVNRVFVHAQIYDTFITHLKKRLDDVKMGDSLDEANDLGPLINKAAVTKINKLVDGAIKSGSKISYQADNLFKGCFYPPTVIENISDDIELFQTEIFGPLISVFKFESEDEVIDRANATQYGLASYVYTESRHRIWRALRALEYGMIGINDVALSNELTSFGGVKQSGLGREGGKSGIHEYLEDKCVIMS